MQIEAQYDNLEKVLDSYTVGFIFAKGENDFSTLFIVRKNVVWNLNLQVLF